MKKRRGRKAFWHNVKFKYKLAIINENTLEEVFGLHVSKLNGLSVLMSACVVIFLIAAVIIIFTPLRNYLPGYMDSQMRSQIVENALRADSLQKALDRQNYYIMNIKDILEGQVKADTVQSIDSLTDKRAEELVARSKEEDEFRKKYEEKERYNLTAVEHNADMAGIVFYRPIRGGISGERSFRYRLDSRRARKCIGSTRRNGDFRVVYCRMGVCDTNTARPQFCDYI